MSIDPPETPEIRLLSGPRPRRVELVLAIRIFVEFIRGFRKLHFVGPCVSVFGSARFGPEHHYYELAEAVGERLAQIGFTVLTGGGPGVMEGANKGAKEAGGRSLGCSIALRTERGVNPWCDDWIMFRYFFVRKVMLVKYSYAFVVLPGGFGTLDEVFETLTLRQTGKIRHFPIVLMGTDYWAPMLEFIERMVDQGTIDDDDYSMLLVTDDVGEMERHIVSNAIGKFGLVRARREE